LEFYSARLQDAEKNPQPQLPDGYGLTGADLIKMAVDISEKNLIEYEEQPTTWYDIKDPKTCEGKIPGGYWIVIPTKSLFHIKFEALNGFSQDNHHVNIQMQPANSYYIEIKLLAEYNKASAEVAQLEAEVSEDNEDSENE